MNPVEIRVSGRYKVGAKIATGSFGNIYLGKNVQSNSEVAIKLEEAKKKNQRVLYEAKILQNLQGGIGVPTLFWYGFEGDFNILVLELLGQNLEQLFQLCNRKFSLKTVLMIADQLISNLEYIHFKSQLHRNIKPENFLTGLGKKSHIIYTIDFSLSKKYRDPVTLDHLPLKDTKQICGTVRYSSVNSHNGSELSRRDDLESLCYMLIYFMKGSLPWQGLEIQNREKLIQQIGKIKKETPMEQLCSGLPKEFLDILQYCRALQYDERPDYGHLKKIVRELFVRMGYEYDYVFDWILIPISQRQNLFLDNQDNTEEKDEKNISIDSYKDQDLYQIEMKTEIYNERRAETVPTQQNFGVTKTIPNDPQYTNVNTNQNARRQVTDIGATTQQQNNNNQININAQGDKQNLKDKKKDKDCVIF